MDKQEIRNVWAAFLEVQEGKHGKKEGMDPVGKADDDIDNDGDVDSSDKYLKNRRKAIGKAMDKDEKKDVKEGELPPALKKNAEKKKKEAGKDDSEDKEEMDEASCGKDRMKKEEKEECPKCKGEGCDHCDGKGYHEMEKETYGKKMKESNLFSADELAALEEKMKHVGTKGPAPSAPEEFMSTSSPKEKKVFKDHEAGSDKKLEDYEEKGEMDAVKAGKGGPGQAPARRGDNLSNGDSKTPVKP